MNFNGNNVQRAISQKHLGLALHSKLDFNEYINNKSYKCNKIIDIYYQEKFLTTITKDFINLYKSFVRPKLNYSELTYDKLFNESLKTKMEII